MKSLFLMLAAFVLSSLFLACTHPKPVPVGNTEVTVGNTRISAPYTHDNLTIFLFLGTDRVKNKTYLTLQEALEQKKVTVIETSNVNELQIENTSNMDVYIQSGDIVRGGRQDRTFGNDYVLAPASGKVPIAAFCVEHGRWHQRGTEDATAFSSSAQMVAGNHMKVAVNSSAHDQNAVWSSVSENQGKITTNAGTDVHDAASPSSFQLTLENKAVKDNTDATIKALSHIIDEYPDAIGYAVAVNGQISSADIYASHALFVKLWPKLLNSSAVEALAELQKDKKFAPAQAADIKTVMEDAQKGQDTEKTLSPRVAIKSRETKDTLYYGTTDSSNPAAPIHEGYLKK